MKKTVVLSLLIMLGTSSLFAQWTQEAMNKEVANLISQAKSDFLPNGCGPAGSPEALLKTLNSLGRYNACVVHDNDYGTLGMSKDDADRRLYNNLIAEGVPRYLAAIFYSAVSNAGQRAYDNAQAQARRNQE